MTLEQAWEWQTAFWVEQDVIAALVKANTGSSGQQLSVLNGAVKRLAVLTVHDQGETPGGTPGAPGPNAGGGGGAGGAGGAPAAENAGGAGSETTEVPRDYKYSPTGRSSHNGFYDTRVADVVMICDSSRLPLILNAINTTNFMSVSNLDVRALTDPTADQGAGYYYGDGHLVLATLQIETAWLRSWTKPLMPKDVRKKLGIPDDAPAAPTDPAAAGGASAPPGNAGSGTPGKPQ